MSKLAKVFLAAAAAQISTENEPVDEPAVVDAAETVEAPEATAVEETPAAPETVPAETAEEEPAAVTEVTAPQPEASEEAPPAEVPAEAAPAEEVAEAPAAATDATAAPAESQADDVVEVAETRAEDVAPAETVEETAPQDDFPAPTNFSNEGEGTEVVSEQEESESLDASDYIAELAEERDMREAAEELDVATESLSDVRDVLDSLNQVGGLDRQTLEFVQIGLEGFTSRFELQLVLLGVSLESFENDEQRQEVSLEHLDETLELIKRGRAEIDKSSISLEDRKVKRSVDILSFESQALVTALQTHEQKRSEELGAVALECIAGLETIRDRVDEINDKGGLSLESLTAASLALEAFTKPLGLDEIELTAEPEKMSRQDRVQASLEAIDQAILTASAIAGKCGISMEADVKELKPGKKVRFSHGHGVIKKIYTAPFKFKGKQHNASKDDPRFEVKDSKGYTTFHKASALKLQK